MIRINRVELDKAQEMASSYHAKGRYRGLIESASGQADVPAGVSS